MQRRRENVHAGCVDRDRTGQLSPGLAPLPLPATFLRS